MTLEEVLLKMLHGNDRRAFKALVKVYGDDVVAILNGLHLLAARIAIASDVSPEDFSAGMKHHWDYVANKLNELACHKH